MGAPATQLTELDPSDLEVIGFNGRPSVACGYSLPVVRHQPSGLGSILSWKSPPQWRPASIFREFVSLERATELPEPFPLPPGVRLGDPLVAAWAHRRELDEVPSVVKAYTQLKLSPLSGKAASVQSREFDIRPDGGTTLVWVEPEVGLVQRFDSWGTGAIRDFDRSLALPKPPWDRLERTADIALCAARDRTVRYQALKRYCLSLYFNPARPPERVETVFRLVVRTEFPDVTWGPFCDSINLIADRGRDLLRYERDPSSGKHLRSVVKGTLDTAKNRRARSIPSPSTN